MTQKEKYLINCDDWFVAPDGNMYKAVWGSIEILNDTFLGIKTNARSTNWFVKVGSDDKHVIIAGCQVHYATKSKYKPNLKGMVDDIVHEKELIEVTRHNRIYIAE